MTPILIAFWVVAAALALGLFLFFWFRRGRKAVASLGLWTETVNIGDWTYRYHVSGRGPDLVLIHGIGADLYCWRSLIPHLSIYFRVWALDLPGFGGSSKLNSERYGLDEQCERLVQFMDRMKIDKTYLVGNSMGGNIALWLARCSPERILGVCAIAPATSPTLVPVNVANLAFLARPFSLLLSRRAISWAHRRTVSHKEVVSEERVEESYRTYQDPEAVKSFIRATEAIRDSRLPEALKSIGFKVLILWGKNDRLVPRKVIDQLKAALVASETHIHESGGHHLQEDDPEWVSHHISRFFARH